MVSKKYIWMAMTTALFLSGCENTDDIIKRISAALNSYENTSLQQANGENVQESVTIATTSSEDGLALIKEKTNVKHKTSKVETKATNWYIRLTAEDQMRQMKTASSQLGALEEDDAVEKHTLKSLTPFGRSYLDIVFIDPKDVEPGEYKSNFHISQEGSEDHWEFTVKTDDTTADIVLGWRGIYVLTPYIDDENRMRYREYRSITNPLVKYMKLIDKETGEEIAAVQDGKVQKYSFNMNGKNTHTFEWVVETEEVKIITPRKSIGGKVLKQHAPLKQKSSARKKIDSFDLTKPPMMKEEVDGR